VVAALTVGVTEADAKQFGDPQALVEQGRDDGVPSGAGQAGGVEQRVALLAVGAEGLRLGGDLAQLQFPALRGHGGAVGRARRRTSLLSRDNRSMGALAAWSTNSTSYCAAASRLSEGYVVWLSATTPSDVQFLSCPSM
jgi:hypothetical protein